jgi:hypothetical protein
MLDPEMVIRIVDFRADQKTQRRIDELADKCNEGQLTLPEQREYDRYIIALDLVTYLQAKARAALKEQNMTDG